MQGADVPSLAGELDPTYCNKRSCVLQLTGTAAKSLRVRLCATPEMAAHQTPPSLGFSWQEHWSGLPFPSPMHESEKWKWSRSVVSDPQQPHGLQPSRLLCPWEFPGKSTGVGCHCLLCSNELVSPKKRPLSPPGVRAETRHWRETWKQQWAKIQRSMIKAKKGDLLRRGGCSRLKSHN